MVLDLMDVFYIIFVNWYGIIKSSMVDWSDPES